MNSSEFDQYDLDDQDVYFEQQEKAKNKVRKRKWREIELIKEQRRLRRELEQYEQYSY